MSELRDRLNALLVDARRAHDRAVAGAARTALASLDNAAAVPTTDHQGVGVGSTEAPRRTLTDADERSLLRQEVEELRAAADEYARLEEPGRAADARRGAEALAAQER